MQCRFCHANGLDESSVFCPVCGEKLDAKRLTALNLVEATGDDFFGFEKGFFYTLITLVKNPSHVVRTYLHGGRKAFHSPVKMYAVVLFLSLLVFSNTGDFTVSYEDGLNRGFSNKISTQTNEKKSAEAIEAEKKKDKERTQILIKHFEENFKNYLHLFFLSWVPIAALFLWLLFSYRGFTLGETLVVSGYFSAITLLLSTLNEVVTFVFPHRFDKGYGLAEALGFVFYYYLIRKLYYRPGRKFHLRIMGFTFLTIVVYMALLGGVVVWSVKTYL